MDGQMDGRTDGWTDRRMNGRTDGWTDKRIDGRLEIYLCDLQDIGPLGPVPKKGFGIKWKINGIQKNENGGGLKIHKFLFSDVDGLIQRPFANLNLRPEAQFV